MSREGDEERAASAAALLGEYLCRSLLRRLSHNAFLYGGCNRRWCSGRNHQRVGQRHPAVSTITGVG
jgi:hypothetical protein